MVGFCGVLGNRQHEVGELARELVWTGDERHASYADSAVHVEGCYHPIEPHPSATSPDGRVVTWVHGNVYGFRDADGYRSRSDETPAEYCARLYAERGPTFFEGLNGDFAGLAYDREQNVASLFSDHLGTRDVFYARPDDGSLLFSTRLQTLPLYPDFTPGLNPEYLVEYVACRRSFGVETPIEGVRLVPPGSVVTFDLDANDHRIERYWTPRYRPRDEPFSAFVERFTDRFQQSMAERTADEGTYGILLSGGSDSRLVVAGMDDEPAVTYHLADWMSWEARTAERVALAADADFRMLRRDSDYYADLLERTPPLSNFVQRFHQAWAEGFMDEIREEVDYLLTGHFADTLFRGYHVPTREVSIAGRTLSLPVERPIETVEEYVDELVREAPTYLDATTADVRAILSKNIRRENGAIVHHGVEFPSMRELALYGRLLPQGTDPFFRQSLRENLPLRIPLYDRRLLDLWLSFPVKYQLRKNVVDRAIARLDADLAAIPHAGSGVPVKYPPSVEAVVTPFARALRHFHPFERPPEDMNHGPWGNLTSELRSGFPLDAIREAEGTIRRLPYLDWDGALRCYEEHASGANHTRTLCALLTFLRMPVVDRVELPDREDESPESEPGVLESETVPFGYENVSADGESGPSTGQD